jgi:tRNA threonylcarbamoyladenosine biosynthesis protein TsaE
MEEKNRFKNKEISDLDRIARQLLEAYPNHRLFAFYGEMGAGKTTMIQVLSRILKVKDTVSSPTFALVNVYETEDKTLVNHFDCYRMETIEEFFDIGYEDYFFNGDYCFIEWAEKVESLLPTETVRVYLSLDRTTGIRWVAF